MEEHWLTVLPKIAASNFELFEQEIEDLKRILRKSCCRLTLLIFASANIWVACMLKKNYLFYLLKNRQLVFFHFYGKKLSELRSYLVNNLNIN